MTYIYSRKEVSLSSPHQYLKCIYLLWPLLALYTVVPVVYQANNFYSFFRKFNFTFKIGEQYIYRIIRQRQAHIFAPGNPSLITPLQHGAELFISSLVIAAGLWKLFFRVWWLDAFHVEMFYIDGIYSIYVVDGILFLSKSEQELDGHKKTNSQWYYVDYKHLLSLISRTQGDFMAPFPSNFHYITW